MLNNRQYIESLCNEIQEKGGIPTVGMLRSRATRQLSIKEVIETLKYWKNNPKPSNKERQSEKVAEAKNRDTLEERVEVLENQVAELTQQLRTL
jgi:uncharacterized protein YceH (UPF0502 family)